MTLVVDAAAVVDVLLRTPRGELVASALARDDLAAPELLDVEVVSALARHVRGGQLDSHHALSAVEDLAGLPVDRVAHALLLRDAWQLRDRIRVNDAFYVACAQLLDAPLLTTDARLARAPLPGVSVLLVR